MDPTAPDIHAGHLVVLDVLRLFQDEGHTAVLIVGDYTARIGDPSGRSETRPVLSREQVEANAQTYLDQAYRVLDRDRTEVRRNSEWLEGMTAADILHLLVGASLPTQGTPTGAQIQIHDAVTKAILAPALLNVLGPPAVTFFSPVIPGRPGSYFEGTP